MEIAPHINVDPAICGGTPVITGTRIPVSIVLGSLASSMSEEAVIEDYVLTREQIKASLAYAASLLQHGDSAILSQVHLAEDWLTDIEDEAWQDL